MKTLHVQIFMPRGGPCLPYEVCLECTPIGFRQRRIPLVLFHASMKVSPEERLCGLSLQNLPERWLWISFVVPVLAGRFYHSRCWIRN